MLPTKEEPRVQAGAFSNAQEYGPKGAALSGYFVKALPAGASLPILRLWFAAVLRCSLHSS